jgi:three-Cys-motif partner protein
MATSFFDEQEEQSRVKAQIVVNYFQAWSVIMAKKAQKIAYIDLYAGPGRYNTGEKSTPLLILERAVASPDLSSRLVAVFNDADPRHANALQAEIDSMPGIDRLKYKPQVTSATVDDSFAKYFEQTKTIPALTFIDPWGYKGLSLRLIRAVVKDFGCECVFFFNYNRINMGITNDLVEPHMRALFGPVRLANLRAEIHTLDPDTREARVRRALGEALHEMGAPYLIPFRFLREGARVSHYICFVSKHPLGYTIMKEIMAGQGVVDDDGVPLFEYLPPLAGKQLPFGAARPIRALPSHLLSKYEGQTMTVQAIVDSHNLGTPFIKRNYKKVLMEMEDHGLILCEPDAASRKKNTMADHVRVTFPRRSAFGIDDSCVGPSRNADQPPG